MGRWESDEEISPEPVKLRKVTGDKRPLVPAASHEGFLGENAGRNENAGLVENGGLVDKLREHSLLNGCRSLESYYEKLNKIAEGSFGMVFRGRCRESGRLVALKSIKDIPELRSEGMCIAAMREFAGLLDLRHPNVIEAVEILIDSNRRVYMVLEYAEHELKVLLSNCRPEFSLSERKRLMVETLKGVEYMHSRGYMHRDLKTANLLYTNDGLIKVCDFGLAKKVGLTPVPHHTTTVATLWYRAPECVLRRDGYGDAMDLWSIGCIFAEIILGKPLFLSASSDTELLVQIAELIGSPSEYDIAELEMPASLIVKYKPSSWRKKFPPPGRSFIGGAITDAGIDLMKGLLTWSPKKRLTASQALNHDFFSESPAPQSLTFMPSVPDTNISGRKQAPSKFAAAHARRDSSESDHSSKKQTRLRVNAKRYLDSLAIRGHCSGLKL